MQRNTPYHLVLNTWKRWMIVNARDPELAWSGSCWVEHEDGISRGRDSVCSFDSREEAEIYAKEIWK